LPARLGAPASRKIGELSSKDKAAVRRVLRAVIVL